MVLIIALKFLQKIALDRHPNGYCLYLCTNACMKDEGLYQPNSHVNLVSMVLHALYLLFCNFINATDYHLGRYEHTSPSGY